MANGNGPGPGRPRKNTPAQLQQLIDTYWALPGRKTLAGMVLAAGYSDRQSFYDLGKLPEFSCIIKNAHQRIVHYYEDLGQEKNNPAFSIFLLKNLGYTDQQQLDITTKGNAVSGFAVEYANLPDAAKPK